MVNSSSQLSDATTVSSASITPSPAHAVSMARSRAHRTEGHAGLAGGGLHCWRQHVVLNNAGCDGHDKAMCCCEPCLGPRREPAVLAVVAVVRQKQLGTNQQDLPVVHDDAAVVRHRLVHHRPVRLSASGRARPPTCQCRTQCRPTRLSARCTPALASRAGTCPPPQSGRCSRTRCRGISARGAVDAVSIASPASQQT